MEEWQQDAAKSMWMVWLGETRHNSGYKSGSFFPSGSQRGILKLSDVKSQAILKHLSSTWTRAVVWAAHKVAFLINTSKYN